MTSDINQQGPGGNRQGQQGNEDWGYTAKLDKLSRDMTKPTKWLCAQRRLRSAWASAQSDQSSLSAWRKLGSLSHRLSAQRRLWSDWADAQADLSLRWAHSHHNQQFVSWIYLYPKTAAAENTLISMGNTFSTCVFFEFKTNRTSVQTDCKLLVFSK